MIIVIILIWHLHECFHEGDPISMYTQTSVTYLQSHSESLCVYIIIFFCVAGKVVKSIHISLCSWEGVQCPH